MDWLDIVIHSAVGLCLVIGMLAMGVPGLIAASLNAFLWFVREWEQKPNHSRVFTHPQSLLEWFVPSLLGFGLAGVL